MVRSLAYALPLTVSLCILSPARADHEDPAVWLDLLDERTFKSAGLDKLSEEELSVLAGLLLQPGGPSYLEDEAVAFMFENGWKPVNVAAVLECRGARRILVQDEDEVTLLEMWSIIDPLPPPGTHWAKDTGGWEVVSLEGKITRFSD